MDVSFLQSALEQLRDVEGLHSKRLFSGHGLYSDETFFGIVNDDRLFFWVSEQTRKKYEALDMSPFHPSEDFESKKYYEVPVEVVENQRELTAWAKEAVTARRQSLFSKKIKID